MKHKFLLCVDNEGYEASLEVRKLYEKIPDKEADRHNQVRIIDESGRIIFILPNSSHPSGFQCRQRIESSKSSLTASTRHGLAAGHLCTRHEHEGEKIL